MAKIYFSFEADSVAEFNEMVSSLALMQQVEKKCCSSKDVGLPLSDTPVTTQELIASVAPKLDLPAVPVLTQQEVQEAAAEEEVKQRRKRRTKAEIEADNAREAAAAAGVVVGATPETVLVDELVKVIAPIEPALEGEVLPAGEAVQTDWVDQANQATGTPSFAPPPPSSTPNFNFGASLGQMSPQPAQSSVQVQPSALPQDLLAALSGMVLPK